MQMAHHLLSVLFVLTLKILSIASDNSECTIQIGERIPNENYHRRLVGLNLPLNCENNGVLTIDLSHEGVTRSFVKVADTVKGRTFSDSFTSWFGEDPMDGSVFSYVQNKQGDIYGSMVDLSNNNIMQFRNEINNSSVVTITPSSDFDRELEPPEKNIHKHNLNSKKLSSSKHVDTITVDPQEMSKQVSNHQRFYDDSGDTLDTMVLWTKTAECEAYGLDPDCTTSSATEHNMQALVNLAIFETNTAFKASGVNTELILVYSYRHPTYVETIDSLPGALNDMTFNKIAGVHSKRIKYGADLVSMLASGSSGCGVGWQGPDKEFMYSVTDWSCATGYYSFGHEIGHNLGLLHDRGSMDECDSEGFNFGYSDPDGSFRTILSYGCDAGLCDNNKGGGCTRIPRYSTPKKLYFGKPIGTERDDNVRQINDVRVKVAGFYTHVVTPNTAPCKDSTLRFKLLKEDGKYGFRYCSWVSNRNTITRCAIEGVSSMCPNTCGTCDVVIDGTAKFKIDWNFRRIIRSCRWIGLRQTKKRCKFPGVSDACRVTCGSVDSQEE